MRVRGVAMRAVGSNTDFPRFTYAEFRGRDVMVSSDEVWSKLQILSGYEYDHIQAYTIFASYSHRIRIFNFKILIFPM